MDITLQQALSNISWKCETPESGNAINKLAEILGDKATYNTETGDWNISIADVSRETKVNCFYLPIVSDDEPTP